jgi:hypothetical protein
MPGGQELEAHPSKTTLVFRLIPCGGGGGGHPIQPWCSKLIPSGGRGGGGVVCSCNLPPLTNRLQSEAGTTYACNILRKPAKGKHFSARVRRKGGMAARADDETANL